MKKSKSIQSATVAIAEPASDHGQYEEFIASLEANYSQVKASPLFETDASEMYESIFIESLPADLRQHYNCRACRDFVNKYGNLVTIDEMGNRQSVLWNAHNAPEFFAPIVRKLANKIERARVTGVFLSSEQTWGKPVTGKWHHMAVSQPAQYKSLVLSASQRMAELTEDYKMLVSALHEYNENTVASALTLLRSEQLYRSEKVLGVAEWIYSLQSALKESGGSIQSQNLIWRAVATAPAGFCHVKSSMIGTLLDDIASGLPMSAIKRHFDLKMNPLQYQRPQAAPTAGNIESAEKIVEKLGIARSLLRRFARIEEVALIWKRKQEQVKPAGGVFGHLTPKNTQPERKMTVSNPGGAIAITWAKFMKTAMTDAVSIQYYAGVRANYTALLTAVDLDAPPILQWDQPHMRNPFSTYVYHGGSMPSDWNITHGWVEVTGISLDPSHWFSEQSNHKMAAIFLLKNAKDTRYKFSGMAIFPETLKTELHAIRSTIEAYSRKGVIEGYDDASACGVSFSGNSGPITVRVQTQIGITDYNIDRWE